MSDDNVTVKCEISDNYLEKEIIHVLKGADLEEITHKGVRKAVEEKLGLNLKSRKNFMKSVVTKWLTELGIKENDVSIFFFPL